MPLAVLAVALFALYFGWIVKIPYDLFKAWLECDFQRLFEFAILVIVALTLTVIGLIAYLKEKQKEWGLREEDLRIVMRHLEEQVLNKSESQETGN
jgi:hypothetical protein